MSHLRHLVEARAPRVRVVEGVKPARRPGVGGHPAAVREHVDAAVRAARAAALRDVDEAAADAVEAGACEGSPPPPAREGGRRGSRAGLWREGVKEGCEGKGVKEGV